MLIVKFGHGPETKSRKQAGIQLTDGGVNGWLGRNFFPLNFPPIGQLYNYPFISKISNLGWRIGTR